ncbi:MAG: serine hydrolase [Methanoregulaceae archaeon]|nr:serine hydrolase [Methanoregulaceae archaeon]
MKTRILTICLLATLLAGCGAPAAKSEEVNAETWESFGAELENLRQQMRIPGMSAAVVKDGQLVWARGFGYADVENGVPATAETPYHLASLTKPFAALVVMQLVQEGKLSLDDPVSRYGVSLPEGDKVTVRHLLSHTSAGTPGAHYQYDGSRYGMLSQVIQAATGRSLQEWLFERILQPLGMDDTAPTPAGCAGLPFAPACERVYRAIARPYQLDENLDFAPGYYQTSFSAGAGLISTVTDLAKLDAALDANTLVTAATKEQMFTPTVSNSGQDLPYGLGWFTQRYRDTRLIWHYGLWPPSISSLFLKLPDEGLTLIVLANIDGLSRPFMLGDGDVMNSLVALTFYKHFVLAPRYGQPLPAIDWSANNSAVLARIREVEDQPVRELLAKEYAARQMVDRSLAQVQQQAEILAGKRARAREVAKSLDPQTLDAYAGEYEIEQLGGATLSVSRIEDGLFIQAPDETPQELLPLSETRFFMVLGIDIYDFEFTMDGTNQVTGLIVTVYGQSYTARRK